MPIYLGFEYFKGVLALGFYMLLKMFVGGLGKQINVVYLIAAHGVSPD